MKGAEEKLWNLNESLERMVEARTKELMEAQEELVRREKLTMLGIVAGNVGNELRNPLGVMSNAVFFLESQLTEADESVREHLEIITKEIDGTKRVLADFVDFFRTRAPRMKKMSVEELIHQSLAEYTMPENITVSVQLPETLPAIKIDPSQMRQVFRNLVTNAVQTMPEGGALRVAACRNDTPVAGVQTGTPQEPAYFVEISIADSGPGISPENMIKVFQPLFTTKSRGIGLGLSICKNLVEANGGRIAVSSEPGTGSVFTIRLPIEKRGT
jgi:signal transduction histidine kinase